MGTSPLVATCVELSYPSLTSQAPDEKAVGTELSQLQWLQIRARKLIQDTKCKEGWNCKWLNVKSLISFDQGVMTYKIMHGLCPESIRHKFVERSMVSEYGTRNHRNLQIPKVWLEYAKRSSYYSGVKNWNDIPDNIREQKSIARLKKVLESIF